MSKFIEIFCTNIGSGINLLLNGRNYNGKVLKAEFKDSSISFKFNNMPIVIPKTCIKNLVELRFSLEDGGISELNSISIHFADKECIGTLYI